MTAVLSVAPAAGQVTVIESNRGQSSRNPLMGAWKTPYETPPFRRIRNEHYAPALREAIKKAEAEVKRIGGMLSNQAFVSKAPEKVVNNEREKLATAEEMLAKNRERLAVVAAKLGK